MTIVIDGIQVDISQVSGQKLEEYLRKNSSLDNYISPDDPEHDTKLGKWAKESAEQARQNPIKGLED